jgi:HNH endonuclease
LRIKVDIPFDKEFTRAYLNRSKLDSRNRVTLVRLDYTGTVMSYARYLLSVKIGRILYDNEEADHINGDPTDDSIDNLQILSLEDHKKKSASERVCEEDTLVCANCLKEFQRPSRVQRYKHNENKFCSYKCNGKFNSRHSTCIGAYNRKITEEDILKMLEMVIKGYSGYRISKEIGKVGTSSIMRWISIIEERFNVKYNPVKLTEKAPKCLMNLL